MTSPALSVHVELGERSYPIEIGAGWLNALGERLRARTNGRKVVVVSDSNVASLYAGPAIESLLDADFETSLCVLDAGETAKSLEWLGYVYDHCLDRGMLRSSTILALGGGVVGDLAGFAAATILRGVDFVQVPTSLVSMVDSSVGGKTGINHPKGKNLIGAFWQPKLVFVDTNMLQTLPREELVSGMAEVIKHGVIADAEYFAFLEAELPGILALEPAAIGHVVDGSCRIKAGVVCADERETTGLRSMLNFGHTLGHALETLAGYGVLRHGEAVALGMEAAGRLAARRRLWSRSEHDRMSRLIARAGLPRQISSEMASHADELLAVMALDKKAVEGRVRFVLPRAIGRVEMVNDISPDEVRGMIADIAAPPEPVD